MLTSDQIFERLDRLGVRNTDIQKVLGLPSSRVSEMRKKTGKRRLNLDEAVKLVEHYSLEDVPPVNPLTIQSARLAVRHVARLLGAAPTDQSLTELALDLQAFVAFVAAPQHREAIRDQEAYFHAVELRRTAQEEDPPADRPSASQ